MKKVEVFLRFVTSEKDSRTESSAGLFTTAYELYRSDLLTANEKNELGDALTWFEKHIPAPKRFSRKRNVSHRETKGISWIKSSATEAVSKLHLLKNIIELHGIDCKILKTKFPGYIVHEDSFQVVAEPFNNIGT